MFKKDHDLGTATIHINADFDRDGFDETIDHICNRLNELNAKLGNIRKQLKELNKELAKTNALKQAEKGR